MSENAPPESLGSIPIVLSGLWTEFGQAHGARCLANLARLSRDTFRWHGVLRGLSHGSSWPGTACSFRLLFGCVFLAESAPSCDSTCESCGRESALQRFLHSVLVNRVDGRRATPDSFAPFITTFVRFLTSLLLSHDSPFRAVASKTLSDVQQRLCGACPVAEFPSVFELMHQVYGERFSRYFFLKLGEFFEGSARRKSTESVTAFLLSLAALGWEASTVDGGRDFDSRLRGACENAASTRLTPCTPPCITPLLQPELLATSLVELLRHTVAALYLPPTHWAAGSSSRVFLQRCDQFMEPSVLLSVVKQMLMQPGSIPRLTGSHEGKFHYCVENVLVTNCDIDRSLCHLKRVEDNSQILIVWRDVHVQLEHDWRIDWSQTTRSYWGKNVVFVKGLSSEIRFSIDPHTGPVIASATVNVGHVDHNCSVLNANLVSEILAQAALDWFADPLTKLIQEASQTALESLVRSQNEAFKTQVWEPIVRRVFPENFLTAALHALHTNLPSHGVPV